MTKEKITYNIILDPTKSLIENLKVELKKCESMVDILYGNRNKVKYYSRKKDYILSLIKHISKIETIYSEEKQDAKL